MEDKVFLSTEIEIDKGEPKCKKFGRNLKIILIVVVVVGCFCAFMASNVKIQTSYQVSIAPKETKSFYIIDEPITETIQLTLKGAFLEGAQLPSQYNNQSDNYLTIWIQLVALKNNPGKMQPNNIYLKENISQIWIVDLVPEELIDFVPKKSQEKIFHLSKVGNNCFIEIKFATNMKTNFPVWIEYDLNPINRDLGVIYSGLVLVGLYICIIFEIIDPTLAAMLASAVSVTILALLNSRPTLKEIVTWIDDETLLLLFSMMIIVTILSDTGIFDYISVFAYKITGGKIWPLINILCFITALFSCFLDNVTTTLLITPVTVKLCETMKLNPVPVLMYMLIFANIGGAITPIGDPPNVIIASNPDVIRAGVNFGSFTIHMGIGSILAIFVVYGQLRYTHRNLKLFKYKEPAQVQELRREIDVLRRAAGSLSSYSKDEDFVKESLLRRRNNLLAKLKLTIHIPNITEDNYKTNLEQLQRQYPIRNKHLLIKSGVTLFLVICVFFMHSIPALNSVGLGMTAFWGALLLLLLCDSEDIPGIVARIEWMNLLFFGSLFILMEAFSRLGLIHWVGKQTESVILSINQEFRLTVAIILILWVSGLASAFVDNVPLTTIMIRIATNLADNRELKLPLQPLVWALSFGACLGGNGSLFGSSSNIVCAGVAERHGYKFTFLEFTKIGFPVMITSMAVVTVYLMICHVVFHWH